MTAENELEIPTKEFEDTPLVDDVNDDENFEEEDEEDDDEVEVLDE